MATANLQVAIADTMAVPPSTAALVNNGAQNAFVGAEIVGVIDATALGSGAYEIGPNLVRQMRGSPGTGHAAGEPFAAAPTVDSTTKVKVGDQYIGQTVYVRVVSPGQDIDDAIEIACVISAPKSPYVTSLPQWADEVPSGTVDGTNTTFALSHAPIPASLSLFVSGAPEDSAGFTISGATLTFVSAPPSGAALSTKYQYF